MKSHFLARGSSFPIFLCSWTKVVQPNIFKGMLAESLTVENYFSKLGNEFEIVKLWKTFYL